MSRSFWKFPVFQPISSNQLPTFISTQNSEKDHIADSGQELLYFQNRASIITGSRINHRLHIYNGIRWITVTVSPERIGHRVGEFSATRKRPIPKKKKQAKTKLK